MFSVAGWCCLVQLSQGLDIHPQGCSQPLVVKIADTEKEKERKRLGKMMEQQAQLGMVNPMANYYQQVCMLYVYFCTRVHS